MVIFCFTVGKIANLRLSHTQKIALNKLKSTQGDVEGIGVAFQMTNLKQKNDIALSRLSRNYQKSAFLKMTG